VKKRALWVGGDPTFYRPMHMVPVYGNKKGKNKKDRRKRVSKGTIPEEKLLVDRLSGKFTTWFTAEKTLKDTLGYGKTMDEPNGLTETKEKKVFSC